MSKIIIYTSKNSFFSEEAKRYFKERNLEFDEKDVAEKENLEEMEKISEQSAVPVISLNGNVIVGFNKEKIQKTLDQAAQG